MKGLVTIRFNKELIVNENYRQIDNNVLKLWI